MSPMLVKAQFLMPVIASSLTSVAVLERSR